METPTVSVVMCVYNAERYVAEAIDSILGQTMRDFEFIIVCDASTDGTEAILRRYSERDARIRVSIHPRQGIPAAANYGCQLARGTYIARMDADDIAFPDRLERQVTFLERNPEVGVLGGALEVIDEEGRVTHRRIPPLEDAEIRKLLLHECCIYQPAVMFRSDVFRASGGYRRAFVYAEDYDLWLRLAERCRLANLPEPLVRYRVHLESVSLTSPQELLVCALGARLSAVLRTETGRDPMDGLGRITPDTLFALGLHDRLGIGESAFFEMILQEYVKSADRTARAGRNAEGISILEAGLEYTRGKDMASAVVAAALWELANLQAREGQLGHAFSSVVQAGVVDPTSSKRLLQRALRVIRG